MKTYFAAVAAAALLVSGCSAGSGAADMAETTGTKASTGQAAAAEEQVEGKYAVSIGDSHLTKDYDGKSTLVVNYTFKNNSEEANSFAVAVSAKAFQDGVELEMAVVTDDKKYDSGSSLKEIKPGASVKVQSAYVLDGKSDVTIEVTESFSLDDAVIAEKTISVK